MRRPLAALLTALLALSLTACDAGDETSETAEASILATPWPLAWLAAQVAPEAEVATLGAAGQDPHDLDLSPAERALLAEADLVVHLGEIGFQPQVESALSRREGPVVAVTEAAPSLLRRPRDVAGPTPPAEDEHADDEHADDEHAEEEHADASMTIDPHVWFEPRILAETALAIGAELAEQQPARAERHLERAAAVATDLRSLAAELDETLTGCRRDVVIVSHEAYGYLLAPRGITQIGISGTGGHGEVSPARLAELTSRIQAEQLPAVLAEPVEGRAPAEALAREAGVPLLEIDPLEAPGQEAREEGLPALLRQQAAVFAGALGCEG
jgi:zinc transport system substrate-binding protein